MKRASLLAAAVIVLIANAFALVHAWRNRSGPVETDITLTERELPLSYNSNDEDSGVSLTLRWLEPTRIVWEGPTLWLDQKTLRELGFDTTVAPSDDHADESYRRQRARRAFVALEYDGPEWRKHVDDTGREAREHPELAQSQAERLNSETRLIVMDASTDAARLRVRHPDRNSVIIIPAVVRIAVLSFQPAYQNNPSRPARLSGSVQEIPSSIHVPRPFSDAFRRLPRDRRGVKYRVRLRFGSSFEPWVVGVEFAAP